MRLFLVFYSATTFIKLFNQSFHLSNIVGSFGSSFSSDSGSGSGSAGSGSGVGSTSNGSSGAMIS